MNIQLKSFLPFCRGTLPGWRIFRLILFYALVWSVLAGIDPASWIIGAPAVMLAVIVSLFLSPACVPRINPAAALLFFPYFIFQSILSGIDVLRRTFSPVPRINPGVFTYRTSLPAGSARILLANVISLQPGTISADLLEEEVVIHVLDTELPARANIRQLEIRIGRIFQESPETGGQA